VTLHPPRGLHVQRERPAVNRNAVADGETAVSRVRKESEETLFEAVAHARLENVFRKWIKRFGSFLFRGTFLDVALLSEKRCFSDKGNIFLEHRDVCRACRVVGSGHAPESRASRFDCDGLTSPSSKRHGLRLPC